MFNGENVRQYSWGKRLWVAGTVLLCLFFVCLFVRVEVDGETAENWDVLFISSYSYDWDSVPLQLDGIQKTLGDTVNVKYLFMDTKTVEQSVAEQTTYESVKYLYEQGEHYDAILVGDDAALEFAQNYQSELFADVPIVFEGINSMDTAYEAAEKDHMTGVVERFPINETIALAQKLYPSATKVVAISDNSISGQGSLEQFYDVENQFPELEFTDINCSTMTAAEIRSYIGEQTEGTILLFQMLTEDATGKKYTMQEGVDLVTENAKIPIFKADEVGIGGGLIGGSVISYSDMSAQACRMLLQIFAGKSVDNIPVEEVDSYYLFDRKVLDQYHILLDLLPENSTFLNEKQTIWQMYRNQVLIGLLIFMAVVIALAFVVNDNRKRRELIREIQKKSNELELSNEKLEENERTLSAAVSHSELYFWEYDIWNNCATQDARNRKIFGNKRILQGFPQCMINEGFVCPESSSDFMDMHTRLRNGEREVWRDIFLRDTVGNYFWGKISYTNYFDENGRPLKAIGILEYSDRYIDLEQRFITAASQTGYNTWIYQMDTKTMVMEQLGDEVVWLDKKIENVPESIIEKGEVHPEDCDKFRRIYERMFAGEKQVSDTIRFLNIETGQWMWNRIVYTVMEDKKNHPVRAIGSMVDVTEQKKAEQRYRMEKIHRLALEDGVLTTIQFNISTDRMTAFDGVISGEKLGFEIGMSLEKLAAVLAERVNGAERDRMLKNMTIQNLRELYENNQMNFTLQYRFQMEDGSSKWLATNVSMTEQPVSGEKIAFISTKNVHLKKMQHLVIEKSVDEYVDYITYLERRDNICHLVKYRKNEIFIPKIRPHDYEEDIEDACTYIDKRDKEIFKESMNMPNLVCQLEQQSSIAVVYRTIPVLGKRRWKKLTAFYMDPETMETVVFVRSDITELYDREQEQKNSLKEALDRANQATKAKSEFLSRMSHDIRTPMNVILGMTQLGIEECESNRDLEFLTKIQASSEFLLALINDILDMSKIESNRFELNPTAVSMKELIAEVLLMMVPKAEEKAITFSYAKVSDDWENQEIQIDKMRFQQVITNLLSNAIKFTPQDGRVELIFHTLQTEGEVRTDQMIIRDNGVGMSQEFLPKLFDAFEQEEGSFNETQQGTGLGMAIVKTIVDAMKGTIVAKSTKGEGTEFTVTFSYQICGEQTVKNQVETEEAEKEKQEIMFEGKRVLLVEDHPINTEIAMRMLQKKGFVVEHAENGQVAVDMFEMASEGYYDLILMDIMMPVMNGMDATKLIRCSNKADGETIPIIAMTANAFSKDMKECLEVGMNAHLGKPIEPAKLFRTIANVLQKAQK